MTATTPADIRRCLIDALQIDLVGPKPSDFERVEEILYQPPSMWYLTGFLVPYEASIEQRSDDAGDEELDRASGSGVGDDENTPEAASARKAFFPSSMGLSFLVNRNTPKLTVMVQWGDYSPIPEEKDEKGESVLQSRTSGSWKRTPCEAELEIPLDTSLADKNQTKYKTYKYEIPRSNGLYLVVTNRTVNSSSCLPLGTRSIALFLVNNRRPVKDNKERDIGYIFQAQLTVDITESFIPRPNPRGQSGDDWDESVAELQYRDVCEYVVGHNVSAVAHLNPDNSCNKICTAWIPTADVEKVVPAKVENVELSMEAIAQAADAEAVRKMLGSIVNNYTIWIAEQRSHIPTASPHREKIAKELLNRAEIASYRIASGLQALDDPKVLEAFQIANRAIAILFVSVLPTIRISLLTNYHHQNGDHFNLLFC